MVNYKIPPNSSSQFDTMIKALVVGSGDALVPVGSSQFVAAKKELRCERRGVPIRAALPDSDGNNYITGFFLDSSDLEELALIVRPGMNVHVRK